MWYFLRWCAHFCLSHEHIFHFIVVIDFWDEERGKPFVERNTRLNGGKKGELTKKKLSIEPKELV